MKLFQTILIALFVLVFSETASAQYGNGYNNGYGNGYGNGNGYGSGRRMNTGMDESMSQQKPKEIPIEVTVAKIMEQLKPALNLDALQEIAIANIVTENIKTQGMLLKAETSQEDKMTNIKALSETTDRKINELLNKDQKEKYILMNEEAKSPKKSKKKKTE